MELTGKTLRDFWIWYLLPEQRKTYKTSSLRGGDNAAKIRFLAMSFAERYGVYVDFLNTKKYEGVELFDKCFNVYFYNKAIFQTHNDIVKQAIEKADEIYNLNQ